MNKVAGVSLCSCPSVFVWRCERNRLLPHRLIHVVFSVFRGVTSPTYPLPQNKNVHKEGNTVSVSTY